MPSKLATDEGDGSVGEDVLIMSCIGLLNCPCHAYMGS